MADNTTLNLNGNTVSVSAAADTPLLYVLTDELAETGPRFGCGLAQCGACSVLVDGVERRACVTPLSAIGDSEVTTLAGLPARHAARHELPEATLTPIQQALIDTQAPQCGYCINGFIIKATELLEQNPAPTDGEIRRALDGHLCRCGIYPTLLEAVHRAAEQTAQATTAQSGGPAHEA